MFLRLGFTGTLSEEDFQMIERFPIMLYDCSSICAEINRCHCDLLTQKCQSVELLPWSQDAFKQHTVRALLVSGLL